MDEYEKIAESISGATGFDVRFDAQKFAYVALIGEDEVVAGYAYEDIVEIVDALLRL